MTVPAFLHRLAARSATLWGATAALLLIAATLLWGHAAHVRDVRALALPLAEQVPELERRLAMLREQAELTELNAATRIQSPEERVHVYALPSEPDLDKLIALFDVLRDALSAEHLLSNLSSIVVGEQKIAEDERIAAYPVTVEFTAQRQGLQSLQTLIDVSGLLTIGDALSPDERARLIDATEAENPAGIVALEQFLGTDLLQYFREPRPIDDQLLKAFGVSAFEATLRDVIRSSLLSEGHRVLGGSLGKTLSEARLWPLQMMRVERIEARSGDAPEWYRVWMELELFTRE